jgi:hypothetical protein
VRCCGAELAVDVFCYIFGINSTRFLNNISNAIYSWTKYIAHQGQLQVLLLKVWMFGLAGFFDKSSENGGFFK